MDINSNTASAVLDPPPRREPLASPEPLDRDLSPPSLNPRPLCDELVQILKLMSDRTRFQILLLLRQKPELHVAALSKLLGQHQPCISHHLGLLREGGLIELRRAGKHNFYRLVPGKYHALFQAIFAEVSPKTDGHAEDRA